jgi:hypothetical protein
VSEATPWLPAGSILRQYRWPEPNLARAPGTPAAQAQLGVLQVQQIQI